MMISLLRLFVVALFAVCCCCQTGPAEMTSKTLDIFSDFALVGYGPAVFGSDGSLDVTYIAPHSEAEKPHPGQLQTRTQYVFHNRGPVNDEQLGQHELPKRLRALGFTVLEAPEFNGGRFSYPYMGGPYFFITFQTGDHKGVIFNRVDGKVNNNKWLVNDYVLIFLS